MALEPPPREEEYRAATRRMQARTHRRMFLTHEPERARSRYSEEDRRVLQDDSTEQLVADRETIRRHQIHEEQKKFGLAT